jgi:hypothetical protein
MCADRSDATKKSTAILHLPATNGAAWEAFKKLGWYQFEHDHDFYHRWTDWIRSNSSLGVGGRPLASYLVSTIPIDASFAEYWGSYHSWQRATLGRHFDTLISGRLGWVPYYRGGTEGDRTRPGDVVAIFPGCTTPIVLRSAGKYFQVVGEAYAHGVIEGEMADLVAQGEYHVQDICLC